MNVTTFLKVLEENPTKGVLFAYEKETYVPPGYHVTEVKKVQIDSVDCGGKAYEEFRTNIQLWTPPIAKDRSFMKAEKIRSIIDRVDRIHPLLRETEVYFEYGNGAVRTSVFSVKSYSIREQQLIFKLFVEPTACRPLQLKRWKEVLSTCCGSKTVCC